MPKVSIIIPAYNQGHYLVEAIDSALEQTFSDFEVIVVDDGSTDDTSRIAHGFTDPRLNYIYQENRGLSAARNTGVCNSTGVYLTFLDSDDRFLPVKLELLVGALEAHPEVGLVAGKAIPIDEQGQPVGKIIDKPLPEDSHKLLLGNPLHVGSVMLRRNWQEKVGLFDESLRSYEDWDMWLRLARAGCKMIWVPQPVSLYRFHSAQMTRIGSQMTRATFAVLDKIYADPDLPESWLSMKDEAYASAYLRAAAQAYLAKDFDHAKACLGNAIELDPELAASDGSTLADQFIAWSDIPKVRYPLQFLESIFDNLPDCVASLRAHRKQHLGRAAIQLAFEAYQRGDYQTTYSATWHAFRYRPQYLMNRGALAIFLRSGVKRRGQPGNGSI